MTKLQLDFLGSFAAYWGNQPVTKFPTDKVRALLAYLALEGERPIRRETLATLLWPEWTDKIAKRNLRQNLHRLNRLLDKLEPNLSQRLLTITHTAVQLNLNPAWVRLDVHEVEAAWRAIIPADPPKQPISLEPFTTAAAHIRGTLLDGLHLPDAPAFHEWLVVVRAQHDRRALQLLHTLADLHLQQGAYAEAESYATRQITLEPCREEAHRQLMHALARQGRRTEAVAQYERCVHLLASEMGLTPKPETAALAAHIAADTLPPLSPPRLHHFPVYLTPFVERVAESAQLAACLQDTAVRLTTLAAPPGWGKTRLAVQVVQRLFQAEADKGLVALCPAGAYFVPLGRMNTAVDMPTILAKSLSLPDTAPLKPYLQDKKLLLLLDDVMPSATITSFLAELLADAPHVRLFVTAVEPLGISGESVLTIAGLAHEAGIHSPAAQLFIQTAGRIRHDFAPSAEDEAAILRICQQTAGSPLALETAATWIRLLTCAQIAHQLEQGVTL